MTHPRGSLSSFAARLAGLGLVLLSNPYASDGAYRGSDRVVMRRPRTLARIMGQVGQDRVVTRPGGLLDVAQRLANVGAAYLKG